MELSRSSSNFYEISGKFSNFFSQRHKKFLKTIALKKNNLYCKNHFTDRLHITLLVKALLHTINLSGRVVLGLRLNNQWISALKRKKMRVIMVIHLLYPQVIL